MKRALALLTALCLLVVPFSFSVFCASRYGDFTYTVLDGARVRIDGFLNRNAAAAVIPAAIDGLPVTEIGARAFKQNNSLTSAEIPNGVTSIGDGAFSYCLKLTSIKWGSALKHIGEAAFSECRALESIDLNSADTLGERCFYNCFALKSADLGDCLTVLPRNTFTGCKALVTVNFSSVLKTVGAYAFSGCEALPSVKFPDSLGAVLENAFYECAALSGVTFPKGAVTLGVYAFLNCESLLTLTVPPNVTVIGKYAFGLATGVDFSHAEDLKITCQKNSAAYDYCVKYSLKPKLIDFKLVLGDLNGDGKVLIDDARKALCIAAEIDLPDSVQLYYADFDGSGGVSARDARLILRKAVGLP